MSESSAAILLFVVILGGCWINVLLILDCGRGRGGK